MNKIQIAIDKVIVTIDKYGREYTLTWTDGVANEWVEYYPLLSLAFARLATLTACAENDWQKYFVSDNNEFVSKASLFLESETE